MSSVNILFLGLSDLKELVGELTSYYKSVEGFEVEKVSSAIEADKYLTAAGNGILLFKVANKQDLTDAVTILKNQKKGIKRGVVKTACFLYVKNKKIEKILSKYGCTDILEVDMKSKTFSFKIDFWSRGIRTVMSKIDKEMSLKRTGQKEETAEDTKKEDFIFVPELQLQSDMFLVKSKSDCKKVLRRWLIRMMAPSPHVGQWFELENTNNSKQPTWKWVFKNPDDQQFVFDDGAWFFSGAKPDFDWKTNLWNFSSDAPRLYFYTRDKKVYSRLKFVEEQIQIAENSQYAKAKEQLIVNSCDSKFEFEGEELTPEEKQKLTDQEARKYKNLEGKGSTDNIDHGLLEGETSTDELDGKLRGKMKDGQQGDLGDPLMGDVNTDFIDNSPLGAEIKEREEKSGHYSGRSNTDMVDRSPLGAEIKEGEEATGPYAGRSSTDMVDRSPLGGRVKEGEKPTGPYEGKSNTDVVDRSPLDSRTKSEHEQNGPLSGKATTDRVDRSPLGGRVQADEELPGPLDGESATDRIERNPMSSKKRGQSDVEEEKSAADLIGKNPIGGKRSQLDETQGTSGKSRIDHSDKGITGPSKYDFKKDGSNKNQQLSPENPLERMERFEEFEGLIDSESLDQAGAGKTHKPAARSDEIEADLDTEEGSDELAQRRELKRSQNQTKGRSENADESHKNPHSKIGIREEIHEEDILDALSEKLTGGTSKKDQKNNSLLNSDKMIGKKVELSTKEEPLPQVIGKSKAAQDVEKLLNDNMPEINLESGSVKVTLKGPDKNVVHICGFEDMFDQDLVLISPKGTFNAGTEVSAMVELEYSSRKVKLNLSGTIEEIEELNESLELLMINVSNLKAEDLKKFMDLYEQRQSSITDFMSLAKGF